MKKMYNYDLTSTDIIERDPGRADRAAGRPHRGADERDEHPRAGRSARPRRISARSASTPAAAAPTTTRSRSTRSTQIEEGISDLREISRFNGKTAVGLGIVKQHGSNAVEVASLVHKKVEQIRATLLPGYHIDVKLDTTKFIKDSVNELNFTLLLVGVADVDRLLPVPRLLVARRSTSCSRSRLRSWARSSRSISSASRSTRSRCSASASPSASSSTTPS